MYSSDATFSNITKLENEMEFDDTPLSKSQEFSKPQRTRSRIPSNSSSTVVSPEAISDLNPVDMVISTTHQSNHNISSTNSITDRSFLSLICYQNTVGAAFYDTDNCVLNVFTEVSESSDFASTLKMCFQSNPEKIIVNSKQKSSCIDAINQFYFNNKESGIEVVTSSFFTYEVAKRRLLNLSCSQLQSDTSNEHKDIWINSVLDLNNKNSIKAAGALLRYIDQNRVGIELEDSFIQAPILSVAQVSIQSSLYLDYNSQIALQIFQNENHPSAVKRGMYSTGKEGLSLFGQMDKTKSRQGSFKLKHWFKTPSRDINVILQRQQAIGYFAVDENLDKILAFNDCLKNVKNLNKIMAKMTASHISVHDWNVLYKTLYNIVCIIDLCNSIEHDIEAITVIKSADFSGLREILMMINKIMDFQESKLKNRFVVKYGIDKELDEKKKVFNGLPDLMTKVAEQELSVLDSRVLECNVIYLPQLGYLLAIPHYPFIKEEDNYALQDLEFMFINKEVVNYKSQHTRELDRLLGDTQSEICDHESGIMHRLQNMILQYVSTILRALDFSAELDCLISMATFSKDFRLTFPHMTTDKKINVVGGKHILYEMCSKQFVPNDTSFDSDNGFMKIISGPNACGKSVYLKQVALIVFMAHIGSPVPADSAEICVCDSIYTRIKCVESISINLSTFVLDLIQVTNAVNCATSRSLIIIDEFGKGTTQNDGIALFSSVMKYWLKKDMDCPFVMAATHYHSIFKLNLLPQSIFLKYQTFDIIRDEQGIVYLYKLVDGYCIHSQANYVAHLAGLKTSIIDRAEEILSLSASKKQITSHWKCKEEHIDIVNKFIKLDFGKVESIEEFLSFLKNINL